MYVSTMVKQTVTAEHYIVLKKGSLAKLYGSRGKATKVLKKKATEKCKQM